MVTQLDVADPQILATQLVDIPSVSGEEKVIADAIEAVLRTCEHLDVHRDGDTIMARTQLGREKRVLIAGHIDTVPIDNNVPHRITVENSEGYLWGRGSVDMLGGVAAALHVATVLSDPAYDVTWIFYDHEEVASSLNGLGRIQRNHPEWLDADFAVLGEPTNAVIEGGCNGTIRVRADFTGRAAHSARSWMGDNAIHQTSSVIAAIATFGNPEVTVDGLAYKESLSVVRIEGGIAGNVVPAAATLWVNYRFAPSKSVNEAVEVVRGFFAGTSAELTVEDAAGGAHPGMDSPLAETLISAIKATFNDAGKGHLIKGDTDLVAPKYGWTDVARFWDMNVPAVNFGPGDPLRAHTAQEAAPLWQISVCADALIAWLSK